jgi:hypothetical protein
MTKDQTISLRILAAMSAGMTLPEAMDSVLGADTYERLAGEILEELRGAK